MAYPANFTPAQIVHDVPLLARSWGTARPARDTPATINGVRN